MAKFWTDDRLAALRQMHADKRPVDEIIARTGALNAEAVGRKLRELGLGPGLQPCFAWTPESVERLINLHNEGLSSSAIGRVLGCSRNAVIGKIHRLGMAGQRPRFVQIIQVQRTRKAPPKQKPPKKIQVRQTRAEAIASFRAEPIPPKQETDIARKRLVDLEAGDCRFPVGDPGEASFGFCAAPVVVGSCYCKHHFVRCFQPPAVKNSRPFIIHQGPFTPVEKEKVEA